MAFYYQITTFDTFNDYLFIFHVSKAKKKNQNSGSLLPPTGLELVHRFFPN